MVALLWFAFLLCGWLCGYVYAVLLWCLVSVLLLSLLFASRFCFMVLLVWSRACGGLGLLSALVRCYWPACLGRWLGFCFDGSGLWLCFFGRCALVVVLFVLLGFCRLVLCRPVYLLCGPRFALGLLIPPPFPASTLLALP